MYGDDNTDGVSLEYQTIPAVTWKDFDDEITNIPKLSQETKDRLVQLSATVKEMYTWFVDEVCEGSPESNLKFPVHIERTLMNALKDDVHDTTLLIWT